jgi:putative iron-regulated protein
MKTPFSKLLLVATLAGMLSFLSGCDSDNEGTAQIDEALNEEILLTFSEEVAQASYNDLMAKAAQLYTAIEDLEESRTNANLQACQQRWRNAREAWEQTESFLFGPVSTEDIDPRIDTWPVNFEDLEDQLASEEEFTEEYIDALEDALKGFHPIEYLIFGENGAKEAEDLTDREIEYLKGLGLNLKALTAEVALSWNPAIPDNYHAKLVNAGKGSAVYSTQKAAFEEIVNAMAGICGEVGDGKMGEVLADLNGEESPYSKNSLIDFTNNMKGVLNVYQAKGGESSLEDLVRAHNLGLDGKIKAAVSTTVTALTSLQEEGKTFQQITDEKPVQVQNAIDAINELKAVLEEQLLPFVQQHAK